MIQQWQMSPSLMPSFYSSAGGQKTRAGEVDKVPEEALTSSNGILTLLAQVADFAPSVCRALTPD